MEVNFHRPERRVSSQRESEFATPVRGSNVDATLLNPQ
jgi:hypothetical protein